MLIIGITGGSGSGKTTALSALADLGAYTIDCDAVYHSLLVKSEDMRAELETEFPGVVHNGIVDRKDLGRRVFQDSAALKKLNAVTHRYVEREVDRLLKQAAQDGFFSAGVDAVELFEGGLGGRCDTTVAVTSPETGRLRRIAVRDGITEESALLRIRAQKPDAYYTARCTYTLVNDCDTTDAFYERCRLFFADLIKGGKPMTREELFYSPKNSSDRLDAAEKAVSDAYSEGYKNYLDCAKTEREAVSSAIALAELQGFRPFERGMTPKAGDKLYRCVRGKALLLAVMGSRPLSEGVNIAAAHVDAPRLDLKQNPLYEDAEMAFFKTHYYGGIRKYQWVTIPLALHGVVVLADGKTVEIRIGEDETDPIFMITDLLPHLAADQNKKTLAEAIPGENLNVLLGSTPDPEDKGEDRVKLAVLKLLHEKYGIREEDFLSAELEVVPAGKARDAGIDRSLIAAYGHDDRVCAYAELKAILETENPTKTAVCILADKEEIGSEGVSGMQSEAFESFLYDLCASQNTPLTHCLERSFCISADVCNAFDPNYPEVSERRNNAKINYGLCVVKFTGSRGKSGSNDASAEVVGKIRTLFAEHGVLWQMGELGKVDQGGGGTVAMYMAKRNIDTIDAGVPVLSMHAPWELVAKLDCYMCYKGMKALYQSE